MKNRLYIFAIGCIAVAVWFVAFASGDQPAAEAPAKDSVSRTVDLRMKEIYKLVQDAHGGKEVEASMEHMSGAISGLQRDMAAAQRRALIETSWLSYRCLPTDGDARRSLSTAANVYIIDPMVQSMMAYVIYQDYASSGDPKTLDLAADRIARVLQVSPKYPVALNLMVQVAISRGDMEAARPWARAYLEHSDEVDPIFYLFDKDVHAARVQQLKQQFGTGN